MNAFTVRKFVLGDTTPVHSQIAAAREDVTPTIDKASLANISSWRASRCGAIEHTFGDLAAL